MYIAAKPANRICSVIYIIGIPTLAVVVAFLVVFRRVDLTAAQKFFIGVLAALVGVLFSTLLFYGIELWEAATPSGGGQTDSDTRIFVIGTFTTVIVTATGYLLSLGRWMRGRFGFGERVFSQRTPQELVDETQGKTSVQVTDITKRHLGTWLRVEGPVEEIFQVYWSCYVTISDDTGVRIEMEMGAWRWGRKLRAMDIGDNLIVEGVIKEISSFAIDLTACEIVSSENI